MNRFKRVIRSGFGVPVTLFRAAFFYGEGDGSLLTRGRSRLTLSMHAGSIIFLFFYDRLFLTNLNKQVM